MRNLKSKLKSQSGASMLMALLLMLVAIMVSAVILTSAVSAAMSIRADREEQQAYLTVSSAAQLLSGELEEGLCDYTHTVTKSYASIKNRENDNFGTVKSDFSVMGKNGKTGAFSDILKAGIEYTATYSADFREEYTISAGEDFDEVEAEFLLKRKTDSDGGVSYTLTVWMTVGEEGDRSRCRICLTAEGKQTTTSTDSSRREGHKPYYDRTTKTQVTWQSISMTRKEA